MAYSVIKKGKFPLCQDNLISLIQYLLVGEDGRQFLLLKLSNNSDTRVKAVKLLITQKDLNGISLETLNVECNKIDAEGGAQFVIDNKIAVSDYCHDFTVNVISADFGKGYAPNIKEKILPQNQDSKDQENENTPRINIKGGVSKAVSTRKFKASVAAYIIIFAIFALSAFITYGHLYITKANAVTFFYNGVEYAFENGDKSLKSPVYAVGCKSRTKDLIIEKEIKGHQVTRIESKAFSGNRNIQRLTIKGDIRIGSYAFEDCDKLSEINFGQTSVIGAYAFIRCESLKELNALNLKEIAASAFSYCTNLKSVKISNDKSVLNIGLNAFMGCSNLAEIDIDQYVDYSDRAQFFSGCNNIKSLRLKNFNHPFSFNDTDYYDPKNRTVLNLFSTNLATDFKQFSSLVIDYCDAIPLNFCYALPLESVTIKNGDITEIGNSAFVNCSNLKKLELPSLLTRVGDYSFYGTALPKFDCSALEYIGIRAFEGCKKLSEFDLRDNSNLSYIGAGAFRGCNALTSVYIASNRITEINAFTFEACANLSDVVLGSKIEGIGLSAFSGCESLQALNLPQGLKSIEESAFEGTALESVIIPPSVTGIGCGAFYNCNSLKEITLPFVGGGGNNNNFFAYIFGGQDSTFDFNTVPQSLKKVTVTSSERIMANSFYNCFYIEEIILEGKPSSIGKNAFYGCRRLSKFIIPASVTLIEDDAFEGCYKLFEVYNLSKLEIKRFEPAFGKAGYYALKIYKTLDGQGIIKAEVNGYKFMRDEEGEWYLTDFDESKTALSFPSLLYNGIYFDYQIVKYLTVDNYNATSVFTSYNVTVIGDYAFNNCIGIKSVTLDNVVKTIGFGAFYGCQELEAITLSFIGGAYENEDSRYFSYIFGAENYYNYGHIPYNLKRVILTGDNIVPDYAFYDCNNIETIVLPDYVTSIGISAFSNCSALTDFTVPLNLISIGEGAFRYCQSLKEIQLPFLLETVANQAFYGCSSLECVAVRGDVSIGEDAFYGCYSLYEVKNHSAGFNPLIGSKDNGNIAYYALTVNKNVNREVIPEAVINGRVFKYHGDNWRLIDYNGTATSLNLTDFTYQGKTISSFTVSPYAFSGKDYPATLTIGAAVTYLYESAFANFYGLKSVKFENSNIKVLNRDMFAYCNSLTSVELPQALTDIGYNAFNSCRQLASIKIPSTVASIEYGAFNGCYSLCDVYNFSGLTVEKGTYENGSVALYALRVNTANVAPLKTAVSDEFNFVFFGGEWYLVSIESVSSMLSLPKSFVYDEETVTSYILLESAFAERFYNSVYIPNAVKKIQRLSPYSYVAVDEITYEGTSQEWQQLLSDVPNSQLGKATLYYQDKE